MTGETDLLQRRLERERLARKQAEQIAEEKSRDLFLKGEALETALAEERKTRKEIGMLLTALETFTAQLDTTEIVKCLHKFLNPLVASRRTSLYLRVGERLQIINVREDSSTEHSQAFCSDEHSDRSWAWLSEQKKPLVIKTGAPNDGAATCLTFLPDTLSALILPLTARGRVIGCLTAEAGESNAFDESNIRFASALSNEASVAIENARLFREVERLSLTDPLTGLNNRRGFDGAARRSVEIAVRHKRPLSALMLDIDHFKDVNDTYGHATGDEVLKGIAHVCRKSIRTTDLLARFGGEEFCLIFPETDTEDSLVMAERLRASVSHLKFKADNNSFNVTVSIGISGCRPAGDSVETLLARSDEALYEAKRAGRNRVAIRS